MSRPSLNVHRWSPPPPVSILRADGETYVPVRPMADFGVRTIRARLKAGLPWADASAFPDGYAIRRGIVGRDPSEETYRREPGIGGPLIITSESIDRAGDIIRMDGGDLGEYVRNPIVLCQHGRGWEFPLIGGNSVLRRAQTRTGVAALEASSWEFSDTSLGRDLGRQYEQGHLRCASVGIVPKSDGYRPIDAMGKALDMTDPEQARRFAGLEYLKWTLYEWSLVVMPMNMDATREMGVVLRSFVDLGARVVHKATCPGVHCPGCETGQMDEEPVEEAKAAPASTEAATEVARETTLRDLLAKEAEVRWMACVDCGKSVRVDPPTGDVEPHRVPGTADPCPYAKHLMAIDGPTQRAFINAVRTYAVGTPDERRKAFSALAMVEREGRAVSSRNLKMLSDHCDENDEDCEHLEMKVKRMRERTAKMRTFIEEHTPAKGVDLPLPKEEVPASAEALAGVPNVTRELSIATAKKPEDDALAALLEGLR